MKKIIGRSAAIPPSLIKKIDKYVYMIDFTILVKEEVTWDKPFLLTVQFSDGTSENILFNDEEFILTNAIIHEYAFSVEVKSKQNIKISLGYLDDNGMEILDFDNPFKSKTIELK